MAFNFSTNKIATKKLIKKFETKVSGRLVVNEGGIDKTLEGVGRVSVLSAEMMGDNLQIVGSVNYNVFYMSSEKTVQSGLVQLDLNEKCKLGEVDAITVLPRIKDTKLVKESSNQILVTAIVELKVYGVVNTEITIVDGTDDGCYTMSKKAQISQLVANANTSFTLSTPLDMINLDTKILMVDASSTVSRVSARENYVEVEGCTNLDVWVHDGEQIKKLQKSVDFTEEVPLLNSTSELILDHIVYDKAVSILTEETMIADITIGISLLGFVSREITLIEDAFSESKMLDLTISSFDNCFCETTRLFSERRNLIADTTDKKRLDEIVFVGGVITEVEQVENKEDGILVVGTVKVPVIYKNYDNDDVLSTTLSSPFEISLSGEWKDAECCERVSMVEISGRVTSYKNKAGKEVSFVVDFDGTVSCQSIISDQFVSKIEKSERSCKKRSSIIVYKPHKNDTVFNIAKTLQVSPDILRAQNPQIEDGNMDSQVVIYTKF